ncbi:hypothetical protein NQZ79_g4835 [Umbelopsis isabellina]|nr:hypothetical protein NQZ79_g4835 [Umbelopsis isabellina]
MRSSIVTIACVIISLALQSNADRILLESPEQGSKLSKSENVQIRYTGAYPNMSLSSTIAFDTENLPTI